MESFPLVYLSGTKKKSGLVDTTTDLWKQLFFLHIGKYVLLDYYSLLPLLVALFTVLFP